MVQGTDARARGMISDFLTDELAELRVKRGARRLMTTPKEIARRTGLSMNVVKTCLAMIAGKRGSARVAVIKIGKTNVVVRLTD